MGFIFLILTLLSFFGFFGCVIWLIVSFFTKAPKKIPIISLITSIVVFMISVPIMSNSINAATGSASDNSVTTDSSKVTADDLEITADGEHTYVDRLEFETNENGIANIEGTTAGDAKVSLTPRSSSSDSQRTKADERGKFNFEVEVSDISQEEYGLQASYNDKMGEKLEVHVRNDYYEDDTDVEEDDKLSDDEVNSYINDLIRQDQGFADGTLDENGNETDNGTPNPEFDWSTTIESVQYDGESTIAIFVNDDFANFTQDEAQSALNKAQNVAYEVIGNNQGWNNKEYRTGLPTNVKYNDSTIATTKVLNTEEFKWK
ncbi:hypothetical protein GCM10025886_01350 [Tetragenococcus halophilus subsp. flandriensis]|nr:hypothetical protein GCM10025886_01350 [Tetragenococcus halophilus subsp. flandriensis]